jgi:hypothetical protein
MPAERTTIARHSTVETPLASVEVGRSGLRCTSLEARPRGGLGQATGLLGEKSGIEGRGGEITGTVSETAAIFGKSRHDMMLGLRSPAD